MSVRVEQILYSAGTVPATAIELVKGLSRRRHDDCCEATGVVEDKVFRLGLNACDDKPGILTQRRRPMR